MKESAAKKEVIKTGNPVRTPACVLSGGETTVTISGEQTVIPGPGNNESPCFSPDGSMLAFASDRTGTPQIFITDADGLPHQLTSEGTNHSPTWTTASK